MTRALDNVVLLAIDSEKGNGPALAKEYKVKGYPTFILLNAEGKTVDRWIGYTKDYFIRSLEEALQDTATIESKAARYGVAPTYKDALTLARYSSAAGEYKQAVEYYRTAQQLDSNKSHVHLWGIFQNIYDGYGQDMFTFDDVLKAGDSVLQNQMTKAASKVEVSMRIVPLLVENNRHDLLAKYLEIGINAAGNESELARAKTQLIIDKHIYLTGDTASAIALKKQLMPAKWKDDPSELNSFAWWCFERGVNLKEAEKLARKGVKLAKPGKEKAMIADTVAEICFARNNKREAIKFAKLAASEDPDNQYYKRQLERFEEKNTK